LQNTVMLVQMDRPECVVSQTLRHENVGRLILFLENWEEFRTVLRQARWDVDISLFRFRVPLFPEKI
jgi:hypothetical protein